MMIPTFSALPQWAMAIGLVLHLAGGFVLGLFYVRILWRSVRRIAAGARIGATLALTFGRFALLAGAFTLASFEGAAPLLALALGFGIARFVLVRRMREVAS